MAQDILFSMGLEGEAEMVSQVNKLVNSINAAFAAIQIPSITLPNLPIPSGGTGSGGGTAPSPAPFNLATASVAELQKELAKMQRQFTQGADTTGIRAVRSRLQELRVEMGAVNPQSFTQRLTSAFSESLASATNWRDKIIQIASGNIIANLFEKVGEGILNVGKFAIQSAGKFESIRASLDVMTGSLEKGGVVFKQFQTLAAKSPFNFDDVAEQGTKLLAMGIPITDVTNRLSRIGDVAAGVGREKLPSIVYAYGQIKSQGKAMAGDLSQFINAGVPIIEVLAQTLKKPQEEIKKLASTGKIGFADIDKALISMTSQGGKFFEMMKTQSNTFEGLWSSMEDAFQLLAVAIGTRVLPIAKDIVIAISNAVSAITDFVSNNDQLTTTESGFSKILQAIGGIAKLIAGPIFSAFGTVLGFIADNIGALSLIVLGLTVAFNAQAIAIAVDTAATVAWNLVNEVGLGLVYGLILALSAAEAAQIALSTATWASTAAAIEFWLVSNPVGWVALGAAITAAGVAYLLLSDNTAKVTKQAQLHQDSVSGVISKYSEEKATVDGLFGVLNTSPRKKQIEDIKAVTTQYGGLLSNINIEKDLLGETEVSNKKKAEQQAAAAKQIIEQYGQILPKYITEQSLIGDSVVAEKNRAEARSIIHKTRLTEIAEEYIAEKKLAVQKELIDLQISNNAERAIDERISKEGFFAKVQRGLSKEWNDKSVSDYREKEQEKLALLEELNKNGVKIAEEAFNQIKDIDSGKGFDENSLLAKTAKAAEYAAGSLKDLQEKLKLTRDVIESVNPSSNSFSNAAKKAITLEDKIKDINDRIKLMGLNADSLAGLQARLSIIQDSINKANPNSRGFDDLLSKSAVYNERIKAIQDRIKEFSLVGGSMEFMNFQVSKINEQLNKQPSGSGLIPGLIQQSKDATEALKNLKIELGLEPPRNSLAGYQSTLSELNKQLNEMSVDQLKSPAAANISTKIAETQKQIDKVSGQIATVRNFPNGLPTIVPINPVDYSTYLSDLGKVIEEAIALKREIAILENATSLSTQDALSLDSKKAQLAELEKGLPSQYENVTRTPTISVQPQVELPKSIEPIPIDILKQNIKDMSKEYATFFGMTVQQTEAFGGKMVELFDQISNAISSGIANGIGNAAFTFGEGIGNMIMGVGTLEDAVVGTLFALGQAFLVEIPKAIGMFMIQTAVGMMVESLGVALPAALPILLIGLGLVGGSGIASGILGGLQKKRQKEKEGQKEIPNVNQSFGGKSGGAAPAAGLSGQNAEKPVLTNIVNITMPVYGLDGIIITKLQQQQIIQQELK